VFEALVITLREGIEAALVIGIILTCLNRGGRGHLAKAVFAGLGAGVLASLAGGFGTGSADDIPKIESLWQQNVATVIVPGAACLVPMRARGYGRIVSVAAGSALKAGRNTAGYAMAKGAVVRWTEALAAETKDQGITANAILPATIDHPVNRAKMPKADPKTWVQPEEAAALILFLTSTEASGITGAAIPITGRV